MEADGSNKSDEAKYRIITMKGIEIPSSYIPLIYARWLNTYLYGNSDCKERDHKAYYKAQHQTINWMLGEGKVNLAVLDDDEDIVLGFSVIRKNKILDYVHIHDHFRKIGIYKRLIPNDLECFTHLTKSWSPIWKNKYRSLKYNPYR